MKPMIFWLLAACCCNDLAQAAGDAVNGKRLYESQCMACHSVDVNLAGPAHRGVFGRTAGMVPGFVYSSALKKSRVVWNETSLDQWLTNPEKLIPGQAMNYSVSKAKDRADLIAYLKNLPEQ